MTMGMVRAMAFSIQLAAAAILPATILAAD